MYDNCFIKLNSYIYNFIVNILFMDNSTKNKRYIKILDIAKTLFWKYGFKKVSVEEICSEAKVSKVTFYKFFPNKLELAKSVYDNAVDESVIKLIEIINEDTTAKVKMKNILNLKMEGANNISKEFLSDFYSNPELGLKDYIEKKTNESWMEILKYFEKAQKDGYLRSDLNINFFFYFSQKLADMITDPYLLSLYQSPQDLIMEMANFFAYGISPNDQ